MRFLWLVVFAACTAAKDGGDDSDTPVDDTDVIDTDEDTPDTPDTEDTDVETDTPETDVHTDLIVDTDPPDTDPSDTDTPDTDAVDTDRPPTDCKSARGICTSTDRCPGASVLPGFAGDCVFDDGPGVCCQAPAAPSGGDTCVSYGGVCAPIAGCNFVDGAFADGSCRDAWPGLVCCVPEDVCGATDQICCGDGVSFVATCDRGTLECNIPGTTLMPEASCPVQ